MNHMRGDNITINIIGAGNLGFHLAKILGDAPNVKVNGIYSRELKNALAAAAYCEAKAFDKLEDFPTSELVIVAVPDNEITNTVEELSKLNNEHNPLVVHTAGVMSSEVIAPFYKRYGTFYPLQTFTKTKPVEWNKIPLCIDASNNEDKELLKAVGSRISRTLYELSDKQREHLHVCAVLANNFVNHLYNLTFDHCKEIEIDPSILYPLIQLTTKKAIENGPHVSQTGPAVRGDSQSIEKHLQLISDNAELTDIYKLFTDLIIKKHTT